MKTYTVNVEQTIRQNIAITVKAKTKEEALEKAKEWDYEEIDTPTYPEENTCDWDNAEIDLIETNPVDEEQEAKADLIRKYGE